MSKKIKSEMRLSEFSSSVSAIDQSILNDRAIRTRLCAHLANMANAPKAILEEVPVHRGNAVADVVTVHNTPHCYEIKGVNDSIHKAVRQGLFYEKAFRKLTLVTTATSIKAAERLMPKYWGLIVISQGKSNLSLSYIRPAISAAGFDKATALQTLWRSELLDADSLKCRRGAARLNRDELSQAIAESTSERKVLEFIAEKLASRPISRGSGQACR